MNNRILTIAAAGAILISTAIGAESPKITAGAAELNASDLASSLGVQWWSYKLRFERPVTSVSVRICEFRRQPDGSWKATPLAPYNGLKHESADIQEVGVAVLIQDRAGDYDCGLRLGDGFTRTKFTSRPDFSHTYSQRSLGRLVGNCLVLAVQEKDERVATGLEENFVRMIGLQVETE